MAGFQTRVAGYLRPDGNYELIQPNQKYCFYINEAWEEVTSINLQKNLQYPGVPSAVFWDNQSVWLPDGIQFYTETVPSPAPPVQQPTWSYFNGSQCIPLAPDQNPIY